MRVRVGGDPRGFSEFKALGDELAKLSHPACPDVDWDKVEQLCLTLFNKNGAELQTVAAYTLTRSQRYGLDGMAGGVALLEALVCEWPRLWPTGAASRVDILGWLFAQLQPLLRVLQTEAWSLDALRHLDAGLERLNGELIRQTQVPLVTLQALRHQVGSSIHRLQSVPSPTGALQPLMRRPDVTYVTPVVILPSPLPAEAFKPRKRRIGVWLCAATAMILLTSAVVYQSAGVLRNEKPAPEPVQLDSLRLFAAGSSEFNSTSTKLLINALAGINARPDWLIVITGHTDTTGDTVHNLQLSQARAIAVRDWMQSMGDIPDSCFAVQGVAAGQPLASNDNEAGRAANRRVDIRLVPTVGACG